MSLEFYNGKKVFVTGHTGFKGSWLSLWLMQLGATVKGYALEPYTPNDHFYVCGLQNEMESQFADVRDLKALKASLTDFQPDVVFHLAAQPLVRLSYSQPIETFGTNVMGTCHIMKLVSELDSVQSFVNVTSDKCYENKELGRAFVETDPMGGRDPYSASKGCSELVFHSFYESFLKEKNMIASSGRAGNVIGGGDWCKDRIMTDAFSSIRDKNSLKVRSPHAIRPWQHVLEPLSGYLVLGTEKLRDLSGQGWNFGPKEDSHVPVSTLIQTLFDYYGEGIWEDVSEEKHLHEAVKLHLNIEKAETQLGWKPALNLQETIGWTARWYKSFFNEGFSAAKNISLEQIDEYTKRFQQN
ncbi:MAG: CDP-glucose 4,6-dehydratase [Bdellovibrionales bacterium]